MANLPFNYTIKYSQRRSLSIRINREGQVQVSVPRRTSDRLVSEFLTNKQDWVLKHLAKYSVVEKHEYKEGEQFWYLGTKHSLTFVDGTFKLTWQDGTFRLGSTLQPKAEEQFTKWYRKQARLLISSRVEHWSKVSGLQYKGLKINNAVSRWGSCSNVGNLNFSLRLVLAPIASIDYVIVHELAHTQHHDHSAKFWALVAAMMPEYQEHERWLKQNGYLLRW